MAPVGWIARAAEPPRRGRACWRKPVIQGTVETFGGVQLYSDPNYLVIQIHTTKCLLRFKLPTLPGNSTYLPGDLGSRRRRFKYRILKKNGMHIKRSSSNKARMPPTGAAIGEAYKEIS